MIVVIKHVCQAISSDDKTPIDPLTGFPFSHAFTVDMCADNARAIYKVVVDMGATLSSSHVQNMPPYQWSDMFTSTNKVELSLCLTLSDGSKHYLKHHISLEGHEEQYQLSLGRKTKPLRPLALPQRNFTIDFDLMIPYPQCKNAMYKPIRLQEMLSSHVKVDHRREPLTPNPRVRKRWTVLEKEIWSSSEFEDTERMGKFNLISPLLCGEEAIDSELRLVLDTVSSARSSIFLRTRGVVKIQFSVKDLPFESLRRLCQQLAKFEDALSHIMPSCVIDDEEDTISMSTSSKDAADGKWMGTSAMSRSSDPMYFNSEAILRYFGHGVVREKVKRIKNPNKVVIEKLNNCEDLHELVAVFCPGNTHTYFADIRHFELDGNIKLMFRGAHDFQSLSLLLKILTHFIHNSVLGGSDCPQAFLESRSPGEKLEKMFEWLVRDRWLLEAYQSLSQQAQEESDVSDLDSTSWCK